MVESNTFNHLQLHGPRSDSRHCEQVDCHRTWYTIPWTNWTDNMQNSNPNRVDTDLSTGKTWGEIFDCCLLLHEEIMPCCRLWKHSDTWCTVFFSFLVARLRIEMLILYLWYLKLCKLNHLVYLTENDSAVEGWIVLLLLHVFYCCLHASAAAAGRLNDLNGMPFNI